MSATALRGEQFSVKKTLWVLGIGFIVGFYTTFVLQCLWNWFAVPALQVPRISYWLMFGLNNLISLLFERSEASEEIRENVRNKQWVISMAVLDACVPDEKQSEVQKDIKQYTDDGIWGTVVTTIFRQLAVNTIALGVGWAIHTALT